MITDFQIYKVFPIHSNRYVQEFVNLIKELVTLTKYSLEFERNRGDEIDCVIYFDEVPINSFLVVRQIKEYPSEVIIRLMGRWYISPELEIIKNYLSNILGENVVFYISNLPKIIDKIRKDREKLEVEITALKYNL